ncbi:SDR family oxidoreductase [Curvibacter sp. HBC61]|uniref:SDR family oxidoreductase n=1 Tax=Curvibacter cyanobacteriorum TaxID=3026422 RepID=A0ABT5N030_9BURK|nr:SDR family oxidoreductase [Curvibacter sp. HBC61]MDD0838929.1 SDR family oxidoreductase [Curvibacter sp. HBC61]
MILVTGATGFVGSALVKRLVIESAFGGVVAVSRRLDVSWPEGVKRVQVSDLLPTTDWSVALRQVDAVVHCAARVHVMQDSASDPLQAYRHVNVEGTLHLARQAAAAGVNRFVFVSSIKVNGESTLPGVPFTANDEPAPLDPYGVSKMEAEQGLQDISAQTGMEVVIVRPPLVYGPGVKANFAAMMRWVARGVPLPLGAIHNARSMVALDNLVDLLVRCLSHPAAAGQTFLVSDGQDVSTTSLLRRTAQAMGKQALLLPVPAGVLQLVAALLGKRDVAQRLCGSLQADISKTRQLLGWSPPLTLDQGLRKAVEGMTL